MRRPVRAVIAAVAGVVLLVALTGRPASAAYPPFDVREELIFNADGRAEEFSTFNGHVWDCIQEYGGQPYPPCYDFGYIGAQGTPAATINCEGKIHVFVVGTNGRLYVKWQVAPRSHVYSHPWFDLGGGLTSNPDAVTVQGRVEVFARGGDLALWTRWQTSSCGAWSNWGSAGGRIIDFPVVQPSLPGLPLLFLQVAATGTDNARWVATRSCGTCSWAWSPG